MFATISIPGGSNFQYRYFALRGRTLETAVSAWRTKWLGDDPTQETLHAVYQGVVLTDREADRVRWRDGSRVYTDFSTPEDAETAREIEAALSSGEYQCTPVAPK